MKFCYALLAVLVFSMVLLGQPGPGPIMGVYNSSPVTFSNGATGPLQMDVNGYLNVDVKAGSSGNAAASATGSAVPASADYCGINVGGTLRGCTGSNPTGSSFAAHVDWIGVNGVTPLTGNGTTGTGSARVTIASDNTAFSVNAVESGTWTVQPGNTANTTPWLVSMLPKTSCGTTYADVAWVAAPTSATSIFGGSTTTCAIDIEVSNTNAPSTAGQTVLVTDGQGSPVTIIPTTVLAGGTSVFYHFNGTKCTSGCKITAGGTGLTYAATGLQ